MAQYWVFFFKKVKHLDNFVNVDTSELDVSLPQKETDLTVGSQNLNLVSTYTNIHFNINFQLILVLTSYFN